ncbi:hypothetical protein [Streptomyces goshikiensis]|uniref:hypothetical protein n=1 Tax=Streptomyces goshikiensis TaxID=1942 RepID=UPI003690DCB2
MAACLVSVWLPQARRRRPRPARSGMVWRDLDGAALAEDDDAVRAALPPGFSVV